MEMMTAYDLTEALRISGTGVWRLESEKDGTIRFYGDHNMNILIGIDDETAPEERFRIFYSRIHPEDIPKFLNYNNSLKSGEKAEIVYRYLHPSKGTIYVRCNGINDDSISEFSCYRGLHQDITKSYLIEKSNTKRSAAQAVYYQKITSKLLGEFADAAISLHISDDNADYEILGDNRRVLPQLGDFNALRQYWNERIFQDNRNDFLKYTSVSFLTEHFAANDSLTFSTYILSHDELPVRLTFWLYSLDETKKNILFIIKDTTDDFQLEEASRMNIVQQNIITTMADIVESRDENTGGHIKRTALYVEIIAKQLLNDRKYTDILTPDYVDDMIVAAPLHDIGKIHVSDTILNKNGKLSSDEYTIMKTHSQIGQNLLKQASGTLGKSTYLDIAMDMACYHHEWWNGKGYPEGRSGDNIPLCARIMAVADVFDAITSKRCYKEAQDFDTAYDIVISESNTHFDPVIIDAFILCRPKIKMAMENNR